MAQGNSGLQAGEADEVDSLCLRMLGGGPRSYCSRTPLIPAACLRLWPGLAAIPYLQFHYSSACQTSAPPFSRQDFQLPIPIFGKDLCHCIFCILQPGSSLNRRAGRNHAIGLPIELLYAAEPEDAVLPQPLQWIAKSLALPVREGVGGGQLPRPEGRGLRLRKKSCRVWWAD